MAFKLCAQRPGAIANASRFGPQIRLVHRLFDLAQPVGPVAKLPTGHRAARAATVGPATVVLRPSGRIEASTLPPAASIAPGLLVLALPCPALFTVLPRLLTGGAAGPLRPLTLRPLTLRWIAL